ncbi:LytR/AlgR family response regulator transcription factor [Tenacibaculum sp. MEBiC06402]|uniref:LytR/AlgR family response regulator transcription factor n=1 Tax=unclassified Tenacibaculum TaxID=2635139 RepID=UPI003B9B90E1
MKINCIIIDDEPTSQDVLKKFVSDISWLEIKGVCNNAIEAIEIIEKEKIDLLFLDINMPKISGLDFYKSLNNPPLVIFTTAYSEYAVDGFNLNAVDYLLKPFSFERFYQSVQKARSIINKNSNQIVLKSDKKLFLIQYDDILYIESLGDYIKVNTQNQSLVVYKTMNTIIDLLPDNKFMRVHKSFIINLEKMNYIEGNQVVIEDYKISIGQKYKTTFLDRIKNIN